MKRSKKKPDSGDLLQQWIDGQAPDPSSWNDAEKCFNQIAEAASHAEDTELATLASVLGQLMEIGSCLDDEAEEVQDLLGFVQAQLPTVLGLAADDEGSSITDAINAAHERWGAHLSIFESDSLGQEVNTDPCLSTDEIEDDLLPADASQVGLLLSVLKQDGGSQASEEGEVPSKETPLQGKTDVSTLPAPPTEINVSVEIQTDDELREAYLDDAHRCLATMEQVVLDSETSSDKSEGIKDFCRQLHTLKGASASVGLADLANYLHQVEEWLEHQSKTDSQHVNEETLLAAIDSVRKQISVLDPSEPKISSDNQPSSQQGPAIQPVHLSTANHSSTGESSVRVRASQLDRLMDMLAELVVIRNRRETRVAELNQLNDELGRCSVRLSRFSDQQHDFFRSLGAVARTSRANGAKMLLGQEPTTSNAVQEVSSDLTEISRGVTGYCKPVSEENQALSHFIRQFRQELMQLRRLPVVGLFQRLQRAARDAATVEQKKVRIELVGEETGLEQTLQEQLFEPLMHVVRNAVSHGIELPGDRESCGKPESGTITLQARANANLLVVSIGDDGRGLDYDALKRRGYERGLLPSDRIPSRQELANLIFHPGFSTRDQASEVAGRGVGMDVVANVIHRLRGRIEIDSKQGTGTLMHFSIPLQTGIDHTMVFRSCGQLFALPMRSISMAQVDVDQGVGNDVGDAVLADLIEVAFSEVLFTNRKDSVTDRHYLILEAEPQLKVVVGHRNDDNSAQGPGRFALLVDEIVGPEEVVVRNLPPVLQGHPLFSGVVLSGNGEIVMLLDAQRLQEICSWKQGVDGSDHGASGSLEQFPASDSPSRKVLIVDDSLSARRSLAKRLRRRGFEIIEAGDGIEALQRLKSHGVYLVMTDLDMPHMNGMELLNEIKQTPALSAPVIVTSSRAQEDIKLKAIERGAVAFVDKPVTEESLTAALDQLETVLT